MVVDLSHTGQMSAMVATFSEEHCPIMDIPIFPAGTPAAKVNAAFDEAGCVVVTGLLEDDTRTEIHSDLAPHMAAARIIEDDDPE